VRDGGVTFDEFLDRVNQHDGGHGGWRFSREETDLKSGQALVVDNVGGEVHSFTEVKAFGGGIVDLLNAALPLGTPAAEPVLGVDPRFMNAGDTRTIANLSRGTHRFQCLIHPGCAPSSHSADAHPARFSFPLRLAYRSPARNTARPSGTATAPIRNSGHRSPHTAPTPAPSSTAARMPSSA
jgi:hypothetical protein